MSCEGWHSGSSANRHYANLRGYRHPEWLTESDIHTCVPLLHDSRYIGATHQASYTTRHHPIAEHQLLALLRAGPLGPTDTSISLYNVMHDSMHCEGASPATVVGNGTHFTVAMVHAQRKCVYFVDPLQPYFSHCGGMQDVSHHARSAGTIEHSWCWTARYKLMGSAVGFGQSGCQKVAAIQETAYMQVTFWRMDTTASAHSSDWCTAAAALSHAHVKCCRELDAHACTSVCLWDVQTLHMGVLLI